MPRLSPSRKQATEESVREAVYRAAVALLTEHGSAALTMDRVAAAAQLAKGSLYNYFDDKLALLQFVYEKSYEPIQSRVDEIGESPATAAAKLEAIARMYFEYVESHRRLFDFLLNDALVRGRLKSKQDSMRAHAIQVLTAIVQQGVASGEFKPVNANYVAEMLLGAVRQVAERQLGTARGGAVEEIVATLLHVFLGGLNHVK